MKTAPIAAALLLLSACGGGGGGTPEPLPDLNPAMGGTWTGTSTVTATGTPPTSVPGALEVAVAGRNATISRVCPDGSGAIVATGSANAAAWTGSLSCPPVSVSACASVVATLTSAHGSLSADGLALTVRALGSASGCGFTLPVQLDFVGAK